MGIYRNGKKRRRPVNRRARGGDDSVYCGCSKPKRVVVAEFRKRRILPRKPAGPSGSEGLQGENLLNNTKTMFLCLRLAGLTFTNDTSTQGVGVDGWPEQERGLSVPGAGP